MPVPETILMKKVAKDELGQVNVSLATIFDSNDATNKPSS